MGLKWAICAALGALMGMMLTFPSVTAEAAWHGIRMWGLYVLPALFPMLVCMLLLTSRLPGKGWLSILLGMMSGSPGGARLCAKLPGTPRDKKRMAALSGTMSPMFLLSTLPAYLQRPALGPGLLLCHLAGAALTAWVLYPPARNKQPAPQPAQPLSLGAAILESGRAMITVCGCIVLGTVAARLIAAALPMLPKGTMIALQCMIEVTGGLHVLSQSALPESPKALLSVMAASFGGLSIQMQNAAFWKESGVGFGHLLCLRFMHALLAGLLFVVFGFFSP